MDPKLCPQFSRVAIVSSITPGTGRRYNGSGFFFLSCILLVWLLCDGSKHCLTSPPSNTILLSALFLIRRWLHRAFCTTALSSASRPNFSIKAVTGINEVWPHLHSKLIWLFVMVANLVMLLLCSGKSRNNSSDFYLFNVTKSDTLSNSISGRLWWANVCAAYRQDLEPFLCF